jgi:RNA polymerase sigma factor (sigma-70 family)
VSYLIYSAVWDYETCWIRETLPDGCPGASSAPRVWSNDELARIRLVLQRLTSLRIENEADAEDLVQETLLTMTQKCPESGPDKGLLIWSMGILRKKIGNYYRKARRYVPMECAEASGRARVCASPELRFLESEMAGMVRKTLYGLPDRERRAMELCLAGLQAHEIVASLHPERYQNVINHLFRGRRKIAAQLAALGYPVPVRKHGSRRCRREAGERMQRCTE